ncbi:hypothetical protein EYF80_062537 [Liparis tanakae]|uniref:Uncharacterized protein n=1 Tax=Liparis tanakae TaxID=230148 RepID=A0A4Z2EEM8_9TELE|nr:hypothetical protein EYF80_062537 [Liparis tanakae]
MSDGGGCGGGASNSASAAGWLVISHLLWLIGNQPAAALRKGAWRVSRGAAERSAELERFIKRGRSAGSRSAVTVVYKNAQHLTVRSTLPPQHEFIVWSREGDH